MTTLQIILWVAIPYASIAVFVVGHIWRYRYDKFGWTTRSSQTYENRLLRWGSPMFHFGILMVIAGHVVGGAAAARAGHGERQLNSYLGRARARHWGRTSFGTALPI